MIALVAMRALAPILGLVFAAGCGGHPIGSKIPRPNKNAAAAIAAGVAGALTVANPKLSGRKPESDDDKKRRPTRVKESVPAGVLDRVDAAKNKDDKRQPCPKDKQAEAKPKPRLELVPRAKTDKPNGIHEQPPCKPAPAAKKPKPTRAP